MKRRELDKYITDFYGVLPEYPWIKHANYAVYRHKNNNKWFAVIMDIPCGKIGLTGGELVCIVNLKCDPILIGSLLKDEGIYPAYHMNKSYWISVKIDEKTDVEKLKWLLDISFGLTQKKK